MIFLFVALPLVVAGILPLVGKISKKVLPDILANGVLAASSSWSSFRAGASSGRGPASSSSPGSASRSTSAWRWTGSACSCSFTVALVGLCISLYSINYMDHYGAKANFYALFLVMLAGMNGLLLVTDLFQVYIFLEVAAVASYALVAFGLGHDELEASFKYLMLSAVASAFILAGHRPHLRRHGRAELRRRRPGAPALDARVPGGPLRRLFHLRVRAQGRPRPVPCLAPGRPPFGAGAHFGRPVRPADQGLRRLRPHPGFPQRLRADAGPVDGPDVPRAIISMVVAALLALGQTRHQADAGLFVDQPGRLHRPGHRPRARPWASWAGSSTSSTTPWPRASSS